MDIGLQMRGLIALYVDEEEVIVLIMAIVVTAIIVEVIQVLLKPEQFLQVLVIKLERNGHLLVLLFCTPAEIKTLTPLRNEVEKRATADLKDIFLCHAWEDRKTTAKNLTDLLVENGTSVWFSENEVLLGTNLLREIDKGLAASRVGIVLVTASFLKRIQGNGIADKELSALLSRDQLIPVLDGVTFEELFDVSPLLASRSGLNTSEETMEDIANKLSEVVSV